MDILIAGGDLTLENSSLFNRLRDHGVEPRWIWPDQSYIQRAFPENCEGVIVLKNWVNHALGDHVCGEARKRNLPLARITSKFSHAAPILRDMGFIETTNEAEEPEEAEEDTAFLEKLCEVTYTVIQTRFNNGTPPTLEGVAQFVQQQLGEEVVLDEITYERALKMAKKKTQEPRPTQSLYEWALLHLEERPELIVDADALHTAVFDDLSAEEQAHTPNDDLEAAVEQAQGAFRTKLNEMCESAHRVLSAGDRLWEMQVEWLRRILPSYMDQEELTHEQRVEIQDHSEEIFGKRVFWKTVTSQFERMRYPQRFGEQSMPTSKPADRDDWISISQAHEYFMAICKTFAVERNLKVAPFERSSAWIREEIRKGNLEGVKSGEGRFDRWLTTYEEVKKFADEWCKQIYGELGFDHPPVEPTVEPTVEPPAEPEIPAEEGAPYPPVLLEMIEALHKRIDLLEAEIKDLKRKQDRHDEALATRLNAIEGALRSLKEDAEVEEGLPPTYPYPLLNQAPAPEPALDLVALLEAGYKITLSK